MKRLWAFLLCACMVFSLFAACNSQDDDEDDDEKNEEKNIYGTYFFDHIKEGSETPYRIMQVLTISKKGKADCVYSDGSVEQLRWEDDQIWFDEDEKMTFTVKNDLLELQDGGVVMVLKKVQVVYGGASVSPPVAPGTEIDYGPAGDAWLNQPVVGNSVGNRCPDICATIVTADGVTGRTVNPAETGTITVINFWGTWCAPSVAELSRFDKLANTYGDTVQVIAIHSAVARDTVPAFIQEEYPDSRIIFAQDEPGYEGDGNGKCYTILGGNGVYPLTVVLDANGIISAVFPNSMTYTDLERAVESLLSEDYEITQQPSYETTKDCLIMATDANFPPYAYYDGNTPVGIDVEIATAIADKLGLALVVKPMEFRDIFDAVTGAEADFAMAAITKTEERGEQVDFSVSYATGHQVLLVKEDSKLSTIDELYTEGSKYVIGVLENTAEAFYATASFDENQVVQFADCSYLIVALYNGQVDCIILENSLAQAYLSSNTWLEVFDPNYICEDYFAIVDKGNDALLMKINQAIEELQQDGTIQNIISKYTSN